MKRYKFIIVLVVLFIMTLIFAGTINVKSGFINPYSATSPYAVCTLVATDTCTSEDLNMFVGQHQGRYRLYYEVDSVRDAIKCKLTVSSSLDKDSTGYHNITTIDSFVTTDTSLISFDSYYYGDPWVRFQWTSWMSPNDTVFVYLGLWPIYRSTTRR